MDLKKVPLYLRDVNLQEDRNPESDGAPMICLTFRAEPFTAAIAEALDPAVKSRLFGKDNEPIDRLKAVKIEIGTELHTLELRPASDADPAVTIQDAQPDAVIDVKRPRKSMHYAATLRFTANHVDERLLAMLVFGWRKNHFVSTRQQQGSMFAETDTTPRLVQGKFGADDDDLGAVESSEAVSAFGAAFEAAELPDNGLDRKALAEGVHYVKRGRRTGKAPATTSKKGAKGNKAGGRKRGR